MGDDYGELIELGFEGMNRFADKYHDTFYDNTGKHLKKIGSKRKKNRYNQQAAPPRHPQYYEQPRARSQPPEHWDEGYSDDDMRSDAQARGSQDGWREDPGRGRSYEAEERYYATPANGYYAAQNRNSYGYPEQTRGAHGYAGGYEVAQPGAPAPYGRRNEVGYANGYGNQWAEPRGRPMPMRRRSSSWSPPRQRERRHGSRRHESQPRREQSNSFHERTAATIVGGVLGGVAGHAANKGKGNSFSTMAGAVLGGLSGRELEKLYDKRKERKERGKSHDAYDSY